MLQEHYNQNSDIFKKTSDFWSYQLNNEIYLKKYPNVIRGSKEYFEIILKERRKYMYYFQKMIDFLSESPTKDLLEVGCGMGTDTIVFERNGFNVTGIDLTQAHLILANCLFQLFGSKGIFVHGNAEQLPFEDCSLGSIYSFGALHHTLNTHKAIREIYRVLLPGGRAVIMLYNKWSLNNLVHFITRRGFENVKKGEDSPITRRFSKKEILSMCSDFSSCAIETEYLFGAGWGNVYSLVPEKLYFILSKIIGWHNIVYLIKCNNNV